MSDSNRKRVPGLGELFYRDHSLTASQYLKEWLWDILFPFHPYVRNALLALRIIHHEGRQPYHIGWLVPGRTAEGLEKHLRNSGFDEDRIAWIDDGEVVGLRRRVNFKYQYHLRLFADGELRGHYELTPECDPFDHMADRETSDHREEFLEFLGGWVKE